MNKKNNHGFVSIFVVIFTAVLISVITIGFIRVMVGEQQQATANDLSNSAYDSALAGVEDAKRVLIKCNQGDTAACAAISSTECNVSVGNLTDIVPDSNGEVAVKNGEAGEELDQAYTCVKIKMDTENYLGSLTKDSYKMIPLKSIASFDKIKIEWFNANNATSNLVPLNNINPGPLFAPASSNTPPVLRSQFIQFSKTGFTFADLDGIGPGKAYNGSNTLFLYPSSVGSGTKTVTLGARRSFIDEPSLITCSNLSASVAYSCSVTITLPNVINSTSYEAFLVLSAFYNDTDYKITLLKSGIPEDSIVNFDGVQPEVDSTGRANDLFRRVKTRVEMIDTNFPYPEAAVDVTGSLCKNFAVTNDQWLSDPATTVCN